MTFGSIVAILCALLVIFIPYGEERQRRNNTSTWITSIQKSSKAFSKDKITLLLFVYCSSTILDLLLI